MNDASSYWAPLCKLVLQLRWWVRVAWKDGGSTTVTPWGQLLTIPTDGYLEGPGGPIPFRLVEWVEVSTSTIYGGIAGRPRRMVNVKEDILTGMRDTHLVSELREGTWSVQGIFDAEPVQMVRIVNPFGPKPEKLS